MGTPRLFIAFDQCLAAGIQEQDLVWNPFSGPLIKDPVQCRQFIAAADVDPQRGISDSALIAQGKLSKFFLPEG